MMKSRVTAPVVAAYYYPGWHTSAHRRVREGQSEWNLLYDDVAKAAYPDVRRPLAGPIDTTIASIEDETQLALSNGITAFLWCWYWERGHLLLNEALEMFLASRIPSAFRYALMWTNKRPHLELPISGVPTPHADRQRIVKTDEHDFRAMIEHLIDHHWHRSSYIVLDGRPLLQVFRVEPLVRQLGTRQLRRLLTLGDEMARSAGFAGVHYVATMHQVHARRRWLGRAGLGRWVGEASLPRLGFRAVTTYVRLPDWDGPPRQTYAALVDKRVAEWPRFRERYGLPFWPSVSPGWDCRPRAVPLDPAPNGHPWAPIVVGENPLDFKRWLNHWKHFAERYGDVPILPISAWNEWTEGYAVAPCDRHGDGMLRAVRGLVESFGSP